MQLFRDNVQRRSPLYILAACALAAPLFFSGCDGDSVAIDGDHFTCDDGVIVFGATCDGFQQCADNSDELGCGIEPGFSVKRVDRGIVYPGYPVAFEFDGVAPAGVEIVADGTIIPASSRTHDQIAVLTRADAEGIVEFKVRSIDAEGVVRLPVTFTPRPSLNQALAGTGYTDAPQLLSGRTDAIPQLLSGSANRLQELSFVGDMPSLLAGVSGTTGAITEGTSSLLAGDTDDAAEAAVELRMIESVLLGGTSRTAGPLPANAAEDARIESLLTLKSDVVAKANMVLAIYDALDGADDRQLVAVGNSVVNWLDEATQLIRDYDVYIDLHGTSSYAFLHSPDGSLTTTTPVTFQLERTIEVTNPDILTAMGDLTATLGVLFDRLETILPTEELVDVSLLGQSSWTTGVATLEGLSVTFPNGEDIELSIDGVEVSLVSEGSLSPGSHNVQFELRELDEIVATSILSIVVGP